MDGERRSAAFPKPDYLRAQNAVPASRAVVHAPLFSNSLARKKKLGLLHYEKFSASSRTAARIFFPLPRSVLLSEPVCVSMCVCICSGSFSSPARWWRVGGRGVGGGSVVGAESASHSPGRRVHVDTGLLSTSASCQIPLPRRGELASEGKSCALHHASGVTGDLLQRSRRSAHQIGQPAGRRAGRRREGWYHWDAAYRTAFRVQLTRAAMGPTAT